jgi:hypothetical protein
MNASLQKLLNKKMTRKNFIKATFLLFVSSFALYGVVEELLSNAATPSGSTEADGGSRTGDTNVITNTAAADGKAVTFGTVGSSTTGAGTGTGSALTPIVPSGLAGMPSKLIFDDEFDTGALNTDIWTPYWFDNGGALNGMPTYSSNIDASDPSVGLKLNLASATSTATITSNPNGGGTGSGVQFTPDNGNVYVEWKVTLVADGNQCANWQAPWMTGQDWPENGEIDWLETGGGTGTTHIHYGDPGTSGEAQGGSYSLSPGIHTIGGLWTPTSVTTIWDGKAIVTFNTTDLFGPNGPNAGGTYNPPMYLLLSHQYYSGDPTVFGTPLVARYCRVWQD